jgi:hypothetical protein
MEDCYLTYKMLHAIDNIQHLYIQWGIIVSDKGTVEYLLAFHNYITSIQEPIKKQFKL